MNRLTKYILKRILIFLPQLIVMTLFVFILIRLIPGNPARLMAGSLASEETLAAINAKFGLDKPIHIQYLIYLRNLLHGDMGNSWVTAQPVTKDLLQRFPVTFELILWGLSIATIVGIAIGTITAVDPGGWVDKATSIYTMTAGVLPDFFFSLLMIYFFYYKFRVFPEPIGRIDIMLSSPTRITGAFTIDALLTGNWVVFKSAASHMAMPVITLAFINAPLILKMTRSTMLNVLQSPYIKFARICGLPSGVVVRQVLRNSLPPVITIVGVLFGIMLGSAVLIETIFSLQGMGQYVVTAIVNSDYAAVQGFVLISGIFSLIIYLIVDVLYVVLDPRITV